MSKPFTNEIAELQQAGIIDNETATRIHNYYASPEGTGTNKLNLVLGLLGALLVSSGIILLIAHNWDELDKLVKTVLAFVPLAIGQALCIFTFLKKKDSLYWREVSSIILFAGIGTCMAIISQVYHINGTLSTFLLTWMLLAVPLVYVLPASIVVLFYIAGISWYGCEIGYSFLGANASTNWYFGLLALLIPHYLRFYNKKENQTYFTFLNWFIALSITICLGTFSDRESNSEIHWLAYISLFCLFVLLGKFQGLDKPGFLRNPFQSVGIVGIYLILFYWSFEWMWKGMLIGSRPSFAFNFMFAFAIGCIVASVALYFYLAEKVAVSPIWLSSFVFIAGPVLLHNRDNIGSLLINFWILLIGILYIRRGSIENKMSVLNFGLLTILALAICRFFDSQIPFIWRGIFFLAAGAGFFVANFLMIKKRASLKVKS